MTGIKYEEKIHFPEGHVYVLMDEDWGVEVFGEQGIDGDLVAMGAWDFKTREAWEEWGAIVMSSLTGFQQADLTPEIRNTLIYDLYEQMPKHIRSEVVEH